LHSAFTGQLSNVAQRAKPLRAQRQLQLQLQLPLQLPLQLQLLLKLQ
jgi:hypothetical protein